MAQTKHPLKKHINLFHAFILTFALAVITLQMARAQQPPAKAPDVVYTKCHLTGLMKAAKCLDLDVPMNWDDPEGQQINLHVAIVPARGGFAEDDPLIVLAGGPGQAATDFGALSNTRLAKINQRRDIIFMDQRGTGQSHSLACTFADELYGDLEANLVTKMMQECLAEHDDVDVRYFTSFDAVKDIDFLRKTLGIEQLNIWGGSYGTRLGLLYMKLHPDHVRSAILDGVTAPNSRLFNLFGQGTQASFDKLVAACAADGPCQEAFPNLKARFYALLDKYRNSPQKMPFKLPMTGEMVDGLVNDKFLSAIVANALYFPTRSSLLPYAITQAEVGNFAPLFALSLEGTMTTGRGIAQGLMASVFCAEDLPRHSFEETARENAGSFQENKFYQYWAAACEGWPTRPVTEGYEDPITVDIPTLILSGALDPVTPPMSADFAVKHLPNVLHLIANNSGHGVSGFGCAPLIMGDFIKTASHEGLDGTCLNTPNRPAFILGPAGPKP